jgi:hypothetical protein
MLSFTEDDYFSLGFANPLLSMLVTILKYYYPSIRRGRASRCDVSFQQLLVPWSLHVTRHRAFGTAPVDGR